MATIKSLLDSVKGLEYLAKPQGDVNRLPASDMPFLSDIGPADSSGDFYRDILEQLELLQDVLEDGQKLLIIHTSQSGRTILVNRINLKDYSDLAVLSGIDLLDEKNCVVLCHVQSLELVIKILDEQIEEQAKRPLGFQQIATNR